MPQNSSRLNSTHTATVTHMHRSLIIKATQTTVECGSRLHIAIHNEQKLGPDPSEQGGRRTKNIHGLPAHTHTQPAQNPYCAILLRMQTSHSRWSNLQLNRQIILCTQNASDGLRRVIRDYYGSRCGGEWLGAKRKVRTVTNSAAATCTTTPVVT
jgi:hypothetical protein